MPNQPAAHKTQTTVSVDRKLLERLAKLAKREGRSRNNLIEILLTQQEAEYRKSGKAVRPEVE